MDVTIITSLYRSESFLRRYVKHVLAVGREVHRAGLALEVMVVANEASPLERRLLDDLVRLAEASFSVKTIFVGREPVYASWNRGIQAATGRCITMWNVDDIRTSGAVIDGYDRVLEGFRLIDFPCMLVYAVKIFGRDLIYHQIELKSFPYDVEGNNALDRKRTGPFFMFERTLFDEVGPFDARFRIVGDFEWDVRASKVTSFYKSTIHGGSYIFHGHNVSASRLLTAEENVVLMLHPSNHDWRGIRTVSPKLMFEVWSKWDSVEVSPEMQDRLWGRTAEQLYRKRKLISDAVPPGIRGILGSYIDRHHLRPYLSRLGLAKAVSTVSLVETSDDQSPVTEVDPNS